MDQFDAYFRRADLDHDGRISGAEAVAFFQGSNLPKPVLAQIWQHADQNRTGFLGRPEFYNALKLVTVAQSKRELTPDIVKAALYGPASAKIPAPQINLAAVPGAQPNSMAPRPPTQQPGAVPSMGPQNFGVRGQGPPNSMAPPSMAPHSMAPPSMAPPSSMQNFTSQGNQSMRPPFTGSRPTQGVGGPNLPRGGGPVVPGLSNSNVSNDWLAGRSVGTPSAPTSQVPIRPVSSIAPNFPTGGSLVGPSPSTAPRPSVGGSDPMFGGDLFSASQFITRPSSSPMPTTPASNAPASTAIVPVTSEPQTPAKIDPLGALNAFTRGPTGAQVQSSMPSVPRPNQQGLTQNISSFGPSGFSAEAKNPAPNQSQPQWPKMTRAGVNKYMKVFMEVDTDRDGKITGEQARNLFLSWRLPREILKQVWDLSDQDNDSMLSVREFCIALYLMERYREGHNLPPTLPSNVLLDETLLTLTGPPNPSYASAGWGATPGLRPQQGMTGAQQMPHAGLRPQMQGAYPRADGQMQYNQQMGPASSMDNSHASKFSNGEQNSFDSNSQETTDTEKEVEDKKVILDSREKMEFYRNKMQDLVLYKSRCDNRLNEITARALGDKREAELLAKKYEERYKQVAEVASKLTIEEASFRDIQERKTELNQALLKMEQGGSADGILQVRADRIQSDLEELLKALAERCKKHGINVKSTAIIELPQGWQPGVPEICAVWDEEWDKFEDEGFSFDVALPANAKSTFPRGAKSSPIDDFSPDSLSNVDHGKSEKPFDHALDIESAYSEDESTRSPAGSPPRQKIFESPTKEDSDSHFGKSFDADTETNRSFDESGWGTFDNTDDVDSVWGFNNDTTKDADNDKHGENYFFESSGFGASPRKTDSPQADTFFQKKSPFGFDDSVPGSPSSRAGTSPRYSGGGAENSFFDSFSRYDSFATNDRSSPKRETFSRFDSMSSTTQDHNFSTFDSMSSTGQDRNFSRFDSMSSTTQDRNFTRFDSMNSSAAFDHSQTYSFDDSDPFGSSGPFRVSSESQPEKKDSDKWAF